MLINMVDSPVIVGWPYSLPQALHSPEMVTLSPFLAHRGSYIHMFWAALVSIPQFTDPPTVLEAPHQNMAGGGGRLKIAAVGWWRML